MEHSNIVGGSTAKRVMHCPGSVKLVRQMPPQGFSKYAAEGTLLHHVISEVLDSEHAPAYFLGREHEGQVLTEELLDEKLLPALAALNDIDPNVELRFAVETRVGFGDLLPGVFGSTDLLGRLGDRVIVLDWKFGSGVAVTAEENEQLMFYAAAAMRTPGVEWVFEGAKEIECIIVQPPYIRRWVTSFDRIRQFERELVYAVKLAGRDDATLKVGDHCRWCTAKPICPLMNGAAQRALQTQIASLPVEQISAALYTADLLEQWISDVRALALQSLREGLTLSGFKLVAKQSRRQWVDEGTAKAALLAHLPESDVIETSLVSPAQAEKKLKKLKLPLPAGLTVAVSSGDTLASVDDPRPPVLLIGRQLSAALSKLV